MNFLTEEEIRGILDDVVAVSSEIKNCKFFDENEKLEIIENNNFTIESLKGE